MHFLFGHEFSNKHHLLLPDTLRYILDHQSTKKLSLDNGGKPISHDHLNGLHWRDKRDEIQRLRT